MAKNLQKKLSGFVLIDTGSYYRWATHLCLEDGVDLHKKSEVYDCVKDRMQLDFMPYKRGSKKYAAKVLFAGEDVNKKLYTNKVTGSVTIVAKYPKVRNMVRKMLRNLAKEKNIIAAGRDIGTRVFPKADVKIFLNPTIDARARRRYKDHVKEGRSTSYGDLKKKMTKRDEDDSARKEGPLKKPKDAFEIDNTYMLPSQTLKMTLDYIYKTDPEIKDIKDEVKEIKQPEPNTTFSSPSSFSDPLSFGNTSNTNNEKKESMRELKKRLKAKYKKQQGGGSFFDKY